MKRAMETAVCVQADDYFGEFHTGVKRLEATTHSTQIVVQ
jgi:hypothetical protein